MTGRGRVYLIILYIGSNEKRKTESRVPTMLSLTRRFPFSDVSDNNSKSGLDMPSPYIPEREQLRR